MGWACGLCPNPREKDLIREPLLEAPGMTSPQHHLGAKKTRDIFEERNPRLQTLSGSLLGAVFTVDGTDIDPTLPKTDTRSVGSG